MPKAAWPRPIILTTTAANQANDASLAKITIGAPVTNWLDLPNPIPPRQGENWGIVLANYSGFHLLVNNSAAGNKWIPPFVADRFQGCNTCFLIITIFDPNPPTGTVTHTGTLLVSFAVEPDYFADEAYPHHLG